MVIINEFWWQTVHIADRLFNMKPSWVRLLQPVLQNFNIDQSFFIRIIKPKHFHKLPKDIPCFCWKYLFVQILLVKDMLNNYWTIHPNIFQRNFTYQTGISIWMKHHIFSWDLAFQFYYLLFCLISFWSLVDMLWKVIMVQCLFYFLEL